MSDLELDGRVAVITGGARGQGRSHARRLARAGASIVICDVAEQLPSVRYPMATSADLEETVRLVEEHDRRCVAVVADVRSTAGMDTVATRAMEEFGRVDILLANAGVMSAEEHSWEISDEQWEETIGVNLTGVFKACRAVIPHMIEGGRGGSIVITSSVAGLRSYPTLTDYVASKHGVVGLMRNLARELGPHAIRVNCVHPSAVMTPMAMNDFFAGWMETHPDLRTWAETDVLPSPILQPDDVTDAIEWLVSDRSRWVTGTTMTVDAGFLVK